MLTPITRDNIDTLLDTCSIEVAMTSGRWWRIRRNGATRRWRRTPDRIRIPIKYGYFGYGAITSQSFRPDGTLDPAYFRVAVD
jgi:hypothetical protein